MSLLEHLVELRSRLSRAALALVVGTIVGYLVFPMVLEVLLEPFCRSQAVLDPSGGECNLVAIRPMEPFSVRMKTSVVMGLFVGGPVIFYQLWRFITPGLTRKERRLALPFVVLSQIMFAVGMVFAYVVIPQGLRILLGMAGDRVDIFLTLDEYISFFLTTSVAFGLVFELPLVLIFLSLVGVITAASLRRARPYAMVAIVVAAAIITPTTDAITLMLMAGPMALFYEMSIGAAWLIERRRRRRR
ncbi:twin-arginine translocase subunit TatC [Nitriliruptor alkaliphilus]|uniref:twin-arginine translocase subunit TatC n=1 Tax=Nitriliruptor alkaliphilus TaxID=427918 RepID=UPI000695B5C1|nr:twin-arginine translocase subunit TatC [Nitriliruptor alkaliphilus]